MTFETKILSQTYYTETVLGRKLFPDFTRILGIYGIGIFFGTFNAYSGFSKTLRIFKQKIVRIFETCM